MQRQEPDEIQKDGVVRLLDVGAVLVHHNHLQGGFRTARACGVCTKGLDGAYAPSESQKPVGKQAGVPEGDRKDKAGDAAPPRAYGDYTPGEADKLLEEA